MGVEHQHIASRLLVLSDKSQLAFGTALGDAALTHRPRWDGSAFFDLSKNFQGDGDWYNKGHDFPTFRTPTEQNSGLQASAMVSDFMAGWLVSQLLNAVTTTGAGPYTHVFKPLATTRQAKVTTIYIEDTAAVKTKYADLAGVELTLSYAPSGIVQAQISFVGSGKMTDGAMAAPPNPVAAPIMLLGSDTDYLIGPAGAPVSIKQYVRSAQVKITREVEVFRGLGGGLYAVQLNVNKTRAAVSFTVRAKDTELGSDVRSLFLNETVQELQINTNSGAAAQMNIKFPALKVRTKPATDGNYVAWQVDATEDDVFKSGANEIIEVTVMNSNPTYLVGA